VIEWEPDAEPFDLHDSGGMPWDFCPECEHAPCVAGFGPSYCTMKPRAIVVARVEYELLQSALVNHDAFTIAVLRLANIAVGHGYPAEYAHVGLVKMHAAVLAGEVV
jgi:hypothetical protein